MPEGNQKRKSHIIKKIMACRQWYAIIFTLVLFPFLFVLPAKAQVSAYDLINLINGMRSSNGLGALSTDSALMACAQSTAETMAASHMTWHIGNVSGRASSFGYNNYNTCFATENFMMGGPGTTISQIAASWSDATHMIPATSSSYCHIGAGVAAASDGLIYYVVQAAYPAGVNGCGYAKSSGSGGNGTSSGVGGGPVSFIQAVVTATPDEDGYVYHKVEEGQTLWAISQAYNVSIQDIQSWNNLNNSTALSLNQILYIPSAAQAGKTPTPQVALTVFPTADERGRYLHIVEEGDTFWSISELWHVSLNSIYQANGMTENDSIGLGWEIVIPVTATATLHPTDNPTVTSEPTETEIPLITPSIVTSPELTVSGSNQSGFLHAPKANSRTYFITGIISVMIIGGCIIAVTGFMKKK